MEQRRYNEGDIIFKEGDPSDCAYEIMSGEVEIFMEMGGQTVALLVKEAGEFLGEIGIADDQPRSASARAKNQVSMVRYKEDEFFHLISTDSTSAERMIIGLCQRLRTISRKLVETTVSRKIIDTIKDAASEGGPHDLPANADAKSESTSLRLTLLPLSNQLIPALPKEGVKVTKLPYVVGRIPVGEESKPVIATDLRIPDSQPFRLSREHFAIIQSTKGYGILDQRSTLGTEVNGEFLGHNFGKDFEYLKPGENKITAGCAGSPFIFKAIVEST